MSDFNSPVKQCPSADTTRTTAELLGNFRQDLIDAGFDREKAAEHALYWGVEMARGSHCSLTVKIRESEAKA